MDRHFIITRTELETGNTSTSVIRGNEDFTAYSTSEAKYYDWDSYLFFLENYAKATKSVVSGDMDKNSFQLLPNPAAEACIAYELVAILPVSLSSSVANIIAAIPSMLNDDDRADVKSQVVETLTRVQRQAMLGTVTLTNLDAMLGANRRGFSIAQENDNAKEMFICALITKGLTNVIAIAEAKAEMDRHSAIIDRRIFAKL